MLFFFVHSSQAKTVVLVIIIKFKRIEKRIKSKKRKIDEENSTQTETTCTLLRHEEKEFDIQKSQAILRVIKIVH